MNNGFKVSVRCATYNQAAYIEDAMNGFCIQHTAFPFVCFIMDDASTDGEQEVIQNYLESHFDLDDNNFSKTEETDDYKLIFARHKENKNCYFAVFYLKYNHYVRLESRKKMRYYSKWESNVSFVAFCEGDDYWISPQKLQRQVEMLEMNPQFTMVYTGFNTVDEQGKDIFREYYENFQKESKTGWNFSKLLNHNYILTNTICLRSDVLSSPLLQMSPAQMDYSVFLAAAANGEFFFIKERMSCYRKVGTGMMATKNNLVQTRLREIHNYYAKVYMNRQLVSFPFSERIRIDISLLLFYTALFISGKDKKGLVSFFKKKPCTSFLYPFAIVWGSVKKVTNPNWHILVGK